MSAVPSTGSSLPRRDARVDGMAPSQPEPDRDWSLSRAVKQAERLHLVAALRHHGGNRTHTASSLGISRKNLWEKVKAHGIHPGEYTDEVPE